MKWLMVFCGSVMCAQGSNRYAKTTKSHPIKQKHKKNNSRISLPTTHGTVSNNSTSTVQSAAFQRYVAIAKGKSRALQSAQNQLTSATRAYSLRYLLIHPEFKAQGNVTQNIGFSTVTGNAFRQSWNNAQDAYQRRVGLSVELPLSLQKLYQLHKSKYDLIQASMELYEVESLINSRLAYLITVVRYQVKNVKISQDALRKYDNAVQLFEKREKRGDITSSTVTQMTLTRAIRSKTRASLMLEEALAELNSALCELEQMLGLQIKAGEICEIELPVLRNDITARDLIKRDRRLIDAWIRMQLAEEDVRLSKSSAFSVKPGADIMNTYEAFGKLKGQSPWRIGVHCNFELLLYNGGQVAEIYNAITRAETAKQQYYTAYYEAERRATQFLCRRARAQDMKHAEKVHSLKNQLNLDLDNQALQKEYHQAVAMYNHHLAKKYNSVIEASEIELNRMERALRQDPMDQDALMHYAEAAVEYNTSVSQKLQDTRDNGTLHWLASVDLPNVIEVIELPVPYKENDLRV